MLGMKGKNGIPNGDMFVVRKAAKNYRILSRKLAAILQKLRATNETAEKKTRTK